ARNNTTVSFDAFITTNSSLKLSSVSHTAGLMEMPDARSLRPGTQQALRERIVHAVAAEAKVLLRPPLPSEYTAARPAAGTTPASPTGQVACPPAPEAASPPRCSRRGRGPGCWPCSRGHPRDRFRLAKALCLREPLADWAARELGARHSRRVR